MYVSLSLLCISGLCRGVPVLLFRGNGGIKWSHALNCWMVLFGMASLLFLLYSNGVKSLVFSFTVFYDWRDVSEFMAVSEC